MDNDTKNMLTAAAVEARKNAYCPYSHYMVGAAVLGANGKVYRGANIENASYGATVCAERTALLTMAADGCRKFEAIAVATGDNFDSAPCCICRQVMLEFCASLDVPVWMICPDGQTFDHTLRELAPLPFMGFEANEDYTNAR